MLVTNLAILVLAGFVGYAVISKVPNTLHTPLMSGTNAIHGIVVLGGILVLGLGDSCTLSKLLLVIAIVFGTINVVGGFLVTDRMLGMFKRKPEPKMTAMPQMVALFNGVGGGAVALIAWVEFRQSGGYQDAPTYVAIFSLFAAIVGSVSFWGSNIAFGKLQEVIPGRPISIGPAQQFVNVALLVAAVACAVAITAGSDAEILMIALLLAAAVLGNFVVLPIGGAAKPVVISLLNAFTGLSAAAT